MKFLLDSSFLVSAVKYKVDVFSEVERFGRPELFTLDLVLDELKEISEREGEQSKQAELALEMVREKGVEVLETEGENTDREIMETAREENFTVCTQDRELIQKLKSEGILVIIIRQGKYLQKI